MGNYVSRGSEPKTDQTLGIKSTLARRAINIAWDPLLLLDSRCSYGCVSWYLFSFMIAEFLGYNARMLLGLFRRN